jgi:hypothetical protein
MGAHEVKLTGEPAKAEAVKPKLTQISVDLLRGRFEVRFL